MNFDNYKFRCSSLGLLMTDSRSKSEPLGETCKSYLLECYVSEKYAREKDVTNKYIEKGLQCEEDSITLYSRLNKKIFFKNDERLKNDFLQGTPDMFVGKTIYEAKLVIDLKSSWDIFTFFNVKTKPVNKIYYWQLQGYMALTGAKKSRLAYCLVDTPETIINDEKRKLAWRMGVSTDDNPLAIEAFEKLEKNMRFSDMPMQERVIEFEIQRNDEDIEKLYERISLCREFLNQFEVGAQIHTPCLV